MKKFLLILMAMFAFGMQNASAQDAPLKIITNHPDFQIKVKRCAASGKTVILDMVLNNLGVNDIENIEVFGSRSEVYDNEGNIYQGDYIKSKVANRPSYEWTTGPFNIPTGVPMRLSICIEGVPQSVESIARLKLFVVCDKWGLNGDKPARFTNIPITRN